MSSGVQPVGWTPQQRSHAGLERIEEWGQMPSKGRAVQGVRSQLGSSKGGQKAFPYGRTCPECGEPLSQYNPGPNCWKHTVGVPWRGPTARPKP